VIFLALCFAAAALGASFTRLRAEQWYQGLHKPAWTPPDWFFGPVWTVLYAVLAVAAWLAWQSAGRIRARVPLFLFGFQLALNVGWAAIFFSLRNPGLALAAITLLWVAVVATAAAFARLSWPAVAVLVPYIGWVTLAVVWNFAIAQANG
jgi:tryptophan-rich sensory protein